MAATIVIEEESGISRGWVHSHNGYYAGDFRKVPVRLPYTDTPTQNKDQQ